MIPRFRIFWSIKKAAELKNKPGTGIKILVPGLIGLLQWEVVLTFTLLQHRCGRLQDSLLRQPYTFLNA